MRRLVHLLASILSVAAMTASPAAAQRSQSIEFGGFGSYWRFYHLYFLKNSPRGGARLAYASSDRLSIEVGGALSQTVGNPPPQKGFVSTARAQNLLQHSVGDQN